MNSTVKTYNVRLRAVVNPVMEAGLEVTGEFAGCAEVEQYANILAATKSAVTGIAWYVAQVVLDSNNFICNAVPAYWGTQNIEVKEVA